MFDVCVIGGGVIGGCILRELTKYKGSICLLEKSYDVATGQSAANSGIVHAGFDALPNTNKAKFNVLGNKLMKKWASELGVEYINNGSIVLGFDEKDREMLLHLLERGKQNGVTDLELVDRDKLLELEPNISDNVECGLLAKTGGIICPYQLTIASVGNAMDNGAQLYYDFEVSAITKNDNQFTIESTKGEQIQAKVIINCAGFNSAIISSLAGDNSYKVSGRKGEYILLDKESGDFAKHTLFTTPTEKGKGILVSPTVDGNILLGPTSVEVGRNGSVDTTTEGLKEVTEMASKMCKNIPFYNTITSFTGVRAYSDKHDFIIEESKVVKGLINCIGIESPGLTSAPAIAEYVAHNLVKNIIELPTNDNFNGKRQSSKQFKSLTAEQKNQLIKQDDKYGKIVCRCEQVTEGEIVNAIHQNPPARSLLAIKRRTRAGMGRCQSGFCQSTMVEILARELNIPQEQVTLKGSGSEILMGKIK